MKKLIAGILGTLVAIGLMAPTGGYPSRPIFQTVNVTSGSVQVTGTTGVQALAVFAANGLNPGTQGLAVGQGGAGATVVLNRGTTPLALSAGVGAPTILNGAQGTGVEIGAPAGGDKGVGTINIANGAFVGGVAIVPSAVKFAFGAFTLGASTCTPTGAATTGISSCAGNAGATVGTITFNAGFTASPICSVNVGNGTLSGPTSASTSTLVTNALTASSTFNVSCLGV